MILGVDTLVRVTEDIVGKVRQRFGSTPQFWGRYFKRPGFSEDYHPASENAVFHANAIRLLPIARQTTRVAGSAPEGAADAILNVDAFTTALGRDYLRKIGGELLMFLDVEGTSDRHPNLSLEYWMGWSTALVAHGRRSGIAMLPAVYCRQNQNATWDAIGRADQLGFPCAGAWVFRMRTGACTKPIPQWEASFNTPSVPMPCPVMLWQFAIDCVFEGGVDFNMVNPDPAVASALLNRLVFPGSG